VGGMRVGRRRGVLRRAEGVGEQGSGSGGGGAAKDRSVVLEESKRLLAMQKELLDQVRNSRLPALLG
jgi:hypothetical protein